VGLFADTQAEYDAIHNSVSGLALSVDAEELLPPETTAMLRASAARAIQESVEADLLVCSMIDRIEEMAATITEIDAEVVSLREQVRKEAATTKGK
jgi:hypothetical protein